MDRNLMYKIMMMAAVAISIGSGLAAVIMIVLAATEHSWADFGSAIVLVVLCVGAGLAADMFGDQVSSEKVFSNHAEQEVLNVKQRRALRQARGEVLLDKALNDIENERQNLIHKRMLESNDPSKPPHQTNFSKKYPDVDDQRQLPRRDDDF